MTYKAIYDMFMNGYSVEAIAKEFNVSYGTIHHILKEMLL